MIQGFDLFRAWAWLAHWTLLLVIDPITALIWPEVSGLLNIDLFLSLRALIAAEETWSHLACIISKSVISNCFVWFRLLLPEGWIFV